jgi:hypothetical protein
MRPMRYLVHISQEQQASLDECGFQSYRFECIACGFVQAGIVDPAGETMAEEIRTRFKSVRLHNHWPCIVCGGQTSGVNVLNESRRAVF